PICRLLLRCLQKDRRQRLAHIADARLELLDAADGNAGSLALERRGGWRLLLPWSIAAALLLVMVALAVNRRDAPDAHVYRTSIVLAGGVGAPVRLGGPFGNGGPALPFSPHGHNIEYI